MIEVYGIHAVSFIESTHDSIILGKIFFCIAYSYIIKVKLSANGSTFQ